MIIVVYSSDTEDQRVFSFEDVSTAEKNVVQIVRADFPRANLRTMVDVRKLENRGGFAIDFYRTHSHDPEAEKV
jgi:hypothetical protein